jgi:hypothetical protein
MSPARPARHTARAVGWVCDPAGVFCRSAPRRRCRRWGWWRWCGSAVARAHDSQRFPPGGRAQRPRRIDGDWISSGSASHRLPGAGAVGSLPTARSGFALPLSRVGLPVRSAVPGAPARRAGPCQIGSLSRRAGSAVGQRRSPNLGGFGEGRLLDTGGGAVRLRLPCGVAVEGEAIELDDRSPSRLAAPDVRALSDGAPDAPCWCTPRSRAAGSWGHPPLRRHRRACRRAATATGPPAAAP